MIQLYATSCSAGLHIVPVVSWEGAPNQLPIFNHTVFTSSFTNHMFRVGLHVTFGINNRRIPIQYPSWSAKGSGEAIELVIAIWAVDSQENH